MKDKDWIGILEAAKFSGKSISTVRRWCDNRLIKSRKHKTGRKIYKSSLLLHLSTNCIMTPYQKKHGTPHEPTKRVSAGVHDTCHERLHERADRIAELKAEVVEFKEQNKMLQMEILKITYELRAILANQTGSNPSAWVRTDTPTSHVNKD